MTNSAVNDERRGMSFELIQLMKIEHAVNELTSELGALQFSPKLHEAVLARFEDIVNSDFAKTEVWQVDKWDVAQMIVMLVQRINPEDPA
tara:strand:- start:3689 stop:3958 length:270 start_codon:yes stop_codon:yes gene_type:complete